MITPRKRNLKVQLDKTPEQIDLVKRMGSKSPTESMAALEAVAQVMADPILKVIEQAPVVSNLYTTLTYESGTTPSIPLDDYFDVRNRSFLNSWSSSQPGGTATNFVQGATELFVQVYPIASAASMNKNYLRAGGIDHLANQLTRLVQEILLIQETNSAFVLFNSLAGARIDGNATNNAANNLTLCRAQAADVFQMDDFNTIMKGYDQVTKSWIGGTPVNDLREITDLLGSPEWMGQIRSIAYQPVNTRNGATTSSGASSLAAPEFVREQIFRGGSVPTLFDVVLHKVYEMGVGASFNSVFSTAIGSVALPGFGTGFGGGTTSTFGATEELVLGLNTEMFDLARLRMTDQQSEFSLVPDDTFTQRSKKLGLVGELTEGYISCEGRSKFGLSF